MECDPVSLYWFDGFLTDDAYAFDDALRADGTEGPSVKHCALVTGDRFGTRCDLPY
jgi:hypothetical protein